MGRRFITDTETNGLLRELTKIHSLVMRDADSGEVHSFADHPGYRSIREGLALLSEATEIIGHNLIKFDLPALLKVYRWKPGKHVLITDTLVNVRVIWPRDKIIERDSKAVKRGTMPGKYMGAHSLAAWGYRLGEYKGEFDGGDWQTWSPAMQTYCEQDTEVTLKLYERVNRELESWDWRQALALEHAVAHIIARQERWGFAFNEAKAVALWGRLTEKKDALSKSLHTVFEPWFASGGTVIPARSLNYKDKKRASVTEGCAYTRIIYTEFNPASRDHIAQRLKVLHGWEPEEFTPEGRAKVDEEVLSRLPYPEAKKLAEYFLLEKRIGQLATGKAAWLRKCIDGRIFGSVNSNGTVTGRMTHSDPNVGQVPSEKAIYGVDCRELFESTAGFVLVGCDADALELRDLAGYMAAFDNGDYIRTVLEGRKEDGTDMHSVNARALGLDPTLKYSIGGKVVSGRDIAKVWFYAFIYGAGDEKLGTIMGKPKGGAAQKAGKRSRASFLANLPALGKIIEKSKEKASTRGYIKGLDGRKVFIRHAHAALNTLLQSAGAIQMKQALVILDASLQSSGLEPGRDYEFCANVHDEWQIDVRPQHVETVKRLAIDAIVNAGTSLNFRCPLAGNAVSGKSWAETH